ncbi:MAG TPA: GTP cyclohydrolase I FolE [Myxococcaceae bacterium]|nr:GTP cyclohydrolase I FolE [Myxococcaceae bacterium]
MDRERIAGLIRELLQQLGEDPTREGLINTPRRVAEALEFLTSGYRGNERELIQKAIFVQETHNMVIARDIELYSLCEHHLLPFFGRCHIGYIAEGRVVGVSKLARLVDLYARRLQLQERLTDEIAHALMDVLKADGVGVVVEAQHLCMMMRGVEKQNSMMTTSAMLGSFRVSVATRTEFLTLIGRHRP